MARGFFIFLIFICKPSIWNWLRNKEKRHQNSSNNQFAAQNIEMKSFCSEEGLSYRSNLNQSKLHQSNKEATKEFQAEVEIH